MKFNSQKHHRRSIRLKGYDYSSEGAYYVTIVTQGRACLFGEIIDEEMHLNEYGRMIVKWWNELPNKFPNVLLGEFVLMPNHFHGIIFIVDRVGADLRDDVGADLRDVGADLRDVGADLRDVGADLRVSPDEEKGGHMGPPLRASLSKLIQWFKTMTTNEYIRGVKQLNWRPFDGRLWQRNYYEHIIRDETELQQKTDYILDNPSRWDEDDENTIRPA